MIKLSIAMITKNEEKKIDKTLFAVYDIADEIIVVDNFSTDNTINILKKYSVKIFSEEWKGYGAQKNSAIEKCSGEWILLIDADEVVSPELKYQIAKMIMESSEYDVYEIKRSAVCFGKTLKYGGWGADYVPRLFRRGVGRYNDKLVHEDFVTNKKMGRIEGPIYHYTYITIEEYLEKFNKYTTLSALEMKKNSRKKSVTGTIFNSTYKFIKMYIFRLGFLDGRIGFIMAMLSSFYNFMKYIKLYDLNYLEKNRNECSRIKPPLKILP